MSLKPPFHMIRNKNNNFIKITLIFNHFCQCFFHQANNTILQIKSLMKKMLKKEGNHQMYHQKSWCEFVLLELSGFETK